VDKLKQNVHGLEKHRVSSIIRATAIFLCTELAKNKVDPESDPIRANFFAQFMAGRGKDEVSPYRKARAHHLLLEIYFETNQHLRTEWKEIDRRFLDTFFRWRSPQSRP
jgi:hypothetical protein